MKLRQFSTSQRQPWPKCGVCYRGTDPIDLCVHMLHAQPVYIYDCIHAGSHPPEDDELRLEELA